MQNNYLAGILHRAMTEKDNIIKMQQKKIEELSQENESLKARIAELEGSSKIDSTTSSKPPSSDGLRKKPTNTSLREKSQKKSGGQLGHLGSTLSMIDSPDKRVISSVEKCENCGLDLSDVVPEHIERRQLFDIPVPQVEVTEFCAEHKRCACGVTSKGEFPAHISAPVQYGPRIRSISVYLNNQQLIPEGRVKDFFHDVFKLSIASATIASFSEKASKRLEGWLANLYSHLANSQLKHLDETGYRINGKTQWLHVMSNEMGTYYRPSHKRGSMFEYLRGTIIHDHFRSYYKLKDVLHALCNAHHLRELKALIEIYKESWAARMATLLRYANKNRSSMKRVNKLYDKIVALGLAFHDSLPPLPKTGKRGRKKRRKGHNLLIRLRDHKEEVLRFMSSESFPFTNNPAEQDIRMMKLRMKISGGFRSFSGTEIFAAIRSFTSTCRKQKMNIFQSIENLFSGNLSALPRIYDARPG